MFEIKHPKPDPHLLVSTEFLHNGLIQFFCFLKAKNRMWAVGSPPVLSWWKNDYTYRDMVMAIFTEKCCSWCHGTAGIMDCYKSFTNMLYSWLASLLTLPRINIQFWSEWRLDTCITLNLNLPHYMYMYVHPYTVAIRIKFTLATVSYLRFGWLDVDVDELVIDWELVVLLQGTFEHRVNTLPCPIHILQVQVAHPDVQLFLLFSVGNKITLCFL